MFTRSIWVVGSLAIAGCSSSANSGGGSAATGTGGGTGAGGAGAGGAGGAGAVSTCALGLMKEGSDCIDPIRRFEPAARVDFNNVVSYGGALTLKLPDPPKSGFRLVVPPQPIKPGEEIEGCAAWAYPTLKNKNVYAATVYTSGALHHSNMYGVSLAATGPSPYPKCAPGQTDLTSQIANHVLPKGDILDVLFANSTQIKDGESIVFPKGMAFKLTTDGREVATTIHWLNVTDREMTSEVVYDFFTMPDDQVTEELVPFVYDNQVFSIPPNSEGHIATTCDLKKPGNIVSVMPHTHRQTKSFVAELVRADGTTESLVNDGAINGNSQIEVFDKPISTEGFTQLRFDCAVWNGNTPPAPIVHGVEQNEMCTLFGYMYPKSAQQMGAVVGTLNTDGSAPPCASLDLGALRK